MPARFFSRTGFVIWILATLGVVCVLPYVLALAPALGTTVRARPLSLTLLAASVAQSAIMLGAMTFSGLWAARKLGRGAPVLDAWCHGKTPPRHTGRRALLAFALGALSGFGLLALDLGVFLRLSPAGVGHLLRQAQPPAWTGLLASFEGGITEEVELRLFLLSLLALGLRFAYRRSVRREAQLPGALFWVANGIAALLFGLGHLPVTARLVALTPVVVTRAIVLNGSLGLVAGALFWSQGFEMAMLCHFAADLVLHVLAPLCQSFLLR